MRNVENGLNSTESTTNTPQTPSFGAYVLTWNFWVEMLIFVISVSGSICIVYQLLQGFLFWFTANLISIVYFSFKKQYPLALQQFGFLIANTLGIVHNYEIVFSF